jgi:protein phosphatase
MAIVDRFADLCRRLFGKRSEQQVAVEEPTPLSPVKIRVGAQTSIGNYRDNNEDRFFVDPVKQLYLVADGMGGQAAGEQASQIAVDMIPRLLEPVAVDCDNEEQIQQAVRQAVKAANEAILAQGIADPSVQNMGTTVVLALVRGPALHVAHLGDSLAYLLRDGAIRVLTTEHNLARALLDQNAISEEELKTHRFRHVLWKYLGSKDATDGPDINKFELRPGDRIVLSSDGLTGVVEDETIRKEVYKHDDPQKCADRLVQLALESGSKDNVTCVVFFVDAV